MVETKVQNSYDLIYIVNPVLVDEGLETVVNNISQYITGKGGVIVETQRWGKKKLAYPVKHYLEGTYVMMKLQMPPAIAKDVEGQLRITEQVIRHILTRAE